LSVGVEALFTSALGLQPPWGVEGVKLDVPAKRIDFEVNCKGALLTCPACGAGAQPVHDRLRRAWRHLDFFQFEAWLHADVPRVACADCGKTTQLAVPWARAGSGFTAAFEALALALCRELPVRQAAALLRCRDKQLWRRIEFYVEQARALESFKGVQLVGIDETRLHKGQSYITVVHDLHAKRLLFACEGRDHQSVVDFAADLKAHGGDPAEVRHVCMDTQEPLGLDSGADRRDALAAALDAQEREGVAATHGAAGGLRTGQTAQQRRASCWRAVGLDELGAALPAGAVQEAGQHDQGALRRGGARHAGSPQQRLRGVDERAASTGQAHGSRLPHRQELHRHRLPALVALEAPAGSPVQRLASRRDKPVGHFSKPLCRQS
jgi:hypothetical protein